MRHRGTALRVCGNPLSERVAPSVDSPTGQVKVRYLRPAPIGHRPVRPAPTALRRPAIVLYRWMSPWCLRALPMLMA